MSLITELIDMATSEKTSTVELLRKCLVLGHTLHNQALVTWANAELNGYSSEDNVPPYRRMHVGAKANMSGPFGAAVRNMPIAPSFLEERHQRLAMYVDLREPISSYEELMRSDTTHFNLPWPQDIVVYYQGQIQTENGCELVEAWQAVGRSSFAQVFDAVKNRTLGLCLELQGELGEGAIPKIVPPEVASQIQKTVTNNIYGGVNVIASDGSQVSNPTLHVENTTDIRNFSYLKESLESGGIASQETAELQEAIAADKPSTFGERTKNWITTFGPKFAMGGVKLAAPLAREVVTGLIKEHLGIK